MAAIGNLVWFIFGGGVMALIWLIFAGLFAITVIGLPIARACLEFAKLAAFPFGKEIIRDTELLGKNNVSGITKSINIALGFIWFPIGLILTIFHFALAIVFFLTIIGIPCGIAHVRIGKFVLFPMGARVVSKKQAYASATANELAKRSALAGTSANSNQIQQKEVVLRKPLSHEVSTNRWGYVFVAPFIIVFCIFNLWPTINTFLLAFQDIRMDNRATPDFDGPLYQFRKLVTDPYFWGALKNTFIIWGFNFAPQLGFALLLAIFLSDTRLNLAGKGLFRAIVYMPNLLTAASVAILFRYLFGEGGYERAPANQFLRAIGFFGEGQANAINFFRNVTFTRGLVAFIQWWMWYGHTLILLMAGITSISESLYESAVVDGANSFQTSIYITLPLLRPMMLFILVTSMIGGMQMFEIPRLITNLQGSPDNAIRTTVLYQYNSAFDFRNLSYGAAISIGIFVITIFLAMLIFFFMQDRSELKKNKGGAK